MGTRGVQLTTVGHHHHDYQCLCTCNMQFIVSASAASKECVSDNNGAIAVKDVEVTKWPVQNAYCTMWVQICIILLWQIVNEVYPGWQGRQITGWGGTNQMASTPTPFFLFCTNEPTGSCAVPLDGPELSHATLNAKNHASSYNACMLTSTYQVPETFYCMLL
jgi:hypothetical protein